MEAAGVIVNKPDGTLLMVTEKRKEFYGQLNFPSGRKEENETLEQCARREAEEETGLFVKIVRKFSSFRINLRGMELDVTLFYAEVLEGNLRPGEDILKAEFLSLAEIGRRDLIDHAVIRIANEFLMRK